MSNLTALNHHLFDQLNRLSKEDLTPEQQAHEIERGKAVAALSKEVINNSRLVLDIAKEYDNMSLNAKQHVDNNLLSSK